MPKGGDKFYCDSECRTCAHRRSKRLNTPAMVANNRALFERIKSITSEQLIFMTGTSCSSEEAEEKPGN